MDSAFRGVIRNWLQCAKENIWFSMKVKELSVLENIFWEDFSIMPLTMGTRADFGRWSTRNNHFCLNAIVCQQLMSVCSRHGHLCYPWLTFNEFLQCISVESDSHIPSPRWSFSFSSSRQCTKFISHDKKPSGAEKLSFPSQFSLLTITIVARA